MEDGVVILNWEPWAFTVVSNSLLSVIVVLYTVTAIRCYCKHEVGVGEINPAEVSVVTVLPAVGP